MPTDWRGVYLDGRTAARRGATIRLLSEALSVTTEQGQTFSWPYHAIRVTQGRYAGEHVRLEHGGPIAEVLLIEDTGFFSSLLRVAPGLASGIHDPSRRKTRMVWTALAAVAALGLAAAVFRWGLPAFATLVAARVPISWEVRLGDTVVDHLVPAENRCDDPILQDRLDQIVSALAAESPSPYTLKVHVADDDTLNAFAAPGGTIVILRGLLKRTTRPEELAGVLAHEIQHITQRHSTRAILHHASAGVLVAALTGDVSGVAAFGLDAARNLGLLRYSRENETAADEKGLEMILAAGIDPSGMIAFYEVLAREGLTLPRPLHYLATHPATGERVARIRQLAEGADSPTLSLGTAEEWAALTTRCHADAAPASS